MSSRDGTGRRSVPSGPRSLTSRTRTGRQGADAEDTSALHLDLKKQGDDNPDGRRTPSDSFLTPPLVESPSQDVSFSNLTHPWTDKPSVMSPTGSGSETDSSRVSFSAHQSHRLGFSAGRPNKRKPSSLASSLLMRPKTPESVNIPSHPRARWDQLRRHVLQPSRPPSSASFHSPHHSVMSSSSSSFSNIPPRAPTPKTSRLARLGFRHVVEQAREAIVDDAHRFSFDIHRACWASRSPDAVKPPRFERELSSGSGTTPFNLPFMSNASLPIVSSASSTVFHTGKKHDLRRPPSLQSFATPNRSTPSLQYLRSVILQGISDGCSANPLPMESLVLATLLGPFLMPGGEPRMDEERALAIEIFDVIARTWSPVDEYSVANRCLWCSTVAIQVPPSMRYQIITNLGRVISSAWQSRPIVHPHTLLAIGQDLYALLASASVSSHPPHLAEETALINQIISDLSGSRIPTIFAMEFYPSAKLRKDAIQPLSKELIQEARARGIEYSSGNNQRYLITTMLEEPSEPSSGASAGLAAALNAQKLNSLAGGALMLLSVATDEPRKLANAKLVAHFIQSRVLTDIENLNGPGTVSAKATLSNVALKVLCMGSTQELTEWAASLVSRWYNEEGLRSMVDGFQSMLHRIIEAGEWTDIAKTLTSIVHSLPHDVCQKLFAVVLPTLNDRLVDNGPSAPDVVLSSFLDRISTIFPRIFYKPLFSCAASSKEHVVANHLRTLLALAKFLPDFWLRDPEMIAVALLTDVGAGKSSPKQANSLSWGTARLGQSVLMFEVIGNIQAVRHRKEEASSQNDHAIVDAVKFALSLETRLYVGLEAKEKLNLIPPSQRLLFCILFRELRLLTRSLKPAPWLPRIVNWFVTYEDASRRYEDELAEAVKKLEELYSMASESTFGNNRRSTMLLSPAIDSVMNTDSNPSLLAAKQTLLQSLAKGFIPKVFKLFVAVSALLMPDDYRRIGPLVWSQHMSATDASTISSASFLIMQCAEKTPLELLTTIEVDLRSSSTETKLDTVRKISTLVNWRFQILTQNVVADRAHRPFRVARGPLPFAATDMGSSLFVLQEDQADLKDNLPLELRKQLAEIGWTSGDQVVDLQYQRTNTPLSILPAYQLDQIDTQQDVLSSPLGSPTPASPISPKMDTADESSLLRRNSSTGGPLYGLKRRSIFVPTLASILPRVATLIFDDDLNVACTTRRLLIDLMRNDPALLIRPVLDFLAPEQKDTAIAMSGIAAFLHVVSTLPPSMAYGLVNHLAGFLKYLLRSTEETPEILRDYAYVMPIISELANQVQDLKFRDIRRAKVELFLIPSGSFWFPPTAPPVTIFPRSLTDVQKLYGATFPRDGVVYLTMVRISQNSFFLNILRRNPADIQYVRKNVSRFVLPSLEPYPDSSPLDLKDFNPNKAGFCSKAGDDTIKMLSLLLSRSHLLLVAEIFRCLSRHLSDRAELAMLVDGINRILLAHGDDINIVAHGLIALLVASTRFKRLFTTAGGYTFVMPIIMKLYAEARDHTGVKYAVEYAVNRFYALHQDGFLYQSLEVITHMLKHAVAEKEWFSKRVFLLFSSLQRTMAANADLAGIHNLNKRQEQEALLLKSAEEQPQKLLPFLRSESARLKDRPAFGLQEEFDSTPLNFGDFIRLILTVIAHNPNILRAELFLHLYRFLVPFLYQASASARSFLRDSIPALLELLMRLSSKPRSAEANASEDSEFVDLMSGTTMQNQMFDKSKASNDPIAMRLDFLSLIVAYVRVGGDLEMASIARVLELMRSMLKDCSQEVSAAISTFLSDFTRCMLIRDHPLPVKLGTTYIVSVTPLISSFGSVLDFAHVFDAVVQLTQNPAYSHSKPFADAVMQLCGAALDFAQSEKLFMVISFRTSLVTLLAQTIVMGDADLLELVHKREPSYEFLAGIVLPLVTRLKTCAELVAGGPPVVDSCLARHPRTWFGFVHYAFSACVGAELAPSNFLQRAKTQVHIRRRRAPSASERMAVVVTSVQILKVLIIRAGEDLKAYLPDIWSFLAAFLRSLLEDADARFAIVKPVPSAFTTPTHTPRNSGQYAGPSTLSISTSLQSPGASDKILQSPRIVDYLCWSLAELLCLHCSPLRLHMKMFIRERIIALDEDLQNIRPYMPQSPRIRRNSSTVFTKARRNINEPASPGTSPKLNPTLSYLNPPDASFSLEGRPATFLSPSSPSPLSRPRSQDTNFGLALPGAKRARSPGRSVSAARLVARSAKVRSPSLIQDTYRRIRVVQTYLGYDSRLLPMPGENEFLGHTDGLVKSWSRHDALRALDEETRKLMEELEETMQNAEEASTYLSEEPPLSPIAAPGSA